MQASKVYYELTASEFEWDVSEGSRGVILTITNP
jgi:hypothetical protein